MKTALRRSLALLALTAAVTCQAQNVRLECLGDLPGPRFLDGQTHLGKVALAPQTGGPYTGTRWRIYFEQ